MAESIMSRDIEPVKPVERPLDVLAQIIISMTGVTPWNRDDLYGFLKSSYPFHSLSRVHFELVIGMLAGRYEDTKIRELKPRVYLDRISNTVQGADGVLLLIYHSGGTIPDRGYFGLRLRDSKEKIGELDEEFVWERSIGDKFNMGAQSWMITAIDHQNVEVVPWTGNVEQAPFWKAEKGNKGHHFYKKIGEFLESWGDRIGEPLFLKELQSRFYMEKSAAGELIGYLKRQKEATGPRLPHRHHIVVEHFDTPDSAVKGRQYSGNGYPGNQKPVTKQFIIHTLWGGRVNKPFDLNNLKQLLEELESGRITYSEIRTVSPSPFAAGLIWQQTKKHMYEADTPRPSSVSRLSDDLFMEVASSQHLRPDLKKESIRRYQEKLQRTAEGYSPRTPEGLLDWTRERVLIPISEWKELLYAMESDHGVDERAVIQPVREKLALIKLSGAAFPSAVTVESLPKLIEAVKTDPDHIGIYDIHAQIMVNDQDSISGEPADPGGSYTARTLKYVKENLKRPAPGAEPEEKNADLVNTIREWLFFYGPVQIAFITEVFGLERSAVMDLLDTLTEDRSVIIDRFSEKAPGLQVCKDLQDTQDNGAFRRGRLRAFFSRDQQSSVHVAQGFPGFEKRAQ